MHDPHPHLTRAYLDAIERGDNDQADRIGAALDARGEADAAAERDRLEGPDALRRAAAFYAAHGIPVFPLVPGGKVPATGHGFKDATTDEYVVGSWWRLTPEANIGTPTGPNPPGCGYDVIDLDGADGVRSFYGLPEDERGVPPIVARSRTTRPGGWHLWVKATGRANRAGMSPGVDYRGGRHDGTGRGYVVLPPSRRLVDGVVRRYAWVDVLPDLLGGAS